MNCQDTGTEVWIDEASEWTIYHYGQLCENSISPPVRDLSPIMANARLRSSRSAI